MINVFIQYKQIQNQSDFIEDGNAIKNYVKNYQNTDIFLFIYNIYEDDEISKSFFHLSKDISRFKFVLTVTVKC